MMEAHNRGLGRAQHYGGERKVVERLDLHSSHLAGSSPVSPATTHLKLKWMSTRFLPEGLPVRGRSGAPITPIAQSGQSGRLIIARPFTGSRGFESLWGYHTIGD